MAHATNDPDALSVLVVERLDRTKNMARYQVLSFEPTLSAHRRSDKSVRERLSARRRFPGLRFAARSSAKS
jgi:hypothetical protein